jgi:hypothetical protein
MVQFGAGDRSRASAGHVPTQQRKRARRFWGGLGVMQRFDERRFARTQARLRGAGDLNAVRVSARIFQGM